MRPSSPQPEPERSMTMTITSANETTPTVPTVRTVRTVRTKATHRSDQPDRRGRHVRRRPGFGSALRSEAIKSASVPAARLIAGLTVVVGGFASWAVAALVDDQVITVANVFGFSTVFTAVFAAVAAILCQTADVEHRTLPLAFLAQPRRAVVIAAKVVVVAAQAVGLALLGLLAGIAGAVAGRVEAGDVGSMPSTAGWAIGFSVLAAILGFGIGLIARRSAGAISGLLVWWLVVENLVTAFAAPRHARFLPFVAGNGMLGFDGDEVDTMIFSPGVSGLIFAGYATATLAIGLLAVARSEP